MSPSSNIVILGSMGVRLELMQLVNQAVLRSRCQANTRSILEEKL